VKPESKIPTLDDLVFEGRNFDYGAYHLRKTYKRRLLVSFLYGTAFFVFFLLIYPLSNLISPELYDQGFPEYRVADVDLSYKEFTRIQSEPPAGASSHSEDMPQKIVADEEVPDIKENTVTESPGKADSVNSGNKGTGTGNQGNSTGNGTGESETVYGSADVNPQFPGGPKAMQQYITDNLIYPEIAQTLNIRGTILIYVVITSDGSLRDVRVTRGLHPELDAEALRVVKSMPLWKPALRGGIPVNVRCTIPITVSSRNARP